MFVARGTIRSRDLVQLHKLRQLRLEGQAFGWRFASETEDSFLNSRLLPGDSTPSKPRETSPRFSWYALGRLSNLIRRSAKTSPNPASVSGANPCASTSCGRLRSRPW